MNLLATLNIYGTYLTENTRASFLSACDRWGCQYAEVVSVDVTNPFEARLRIWDYLPGCDRVAFIDGDTLIREDCPSLFNVVPPTFFGCVPNFQGGHDEHAMADYAAMAHVFGCPKPYDRATFFNGGLTVMTADLHRSTWEYAASVALDVCRMLDRPIHPNWEQGALNVAFARSACPVAMLPIEYNRHGPEVWDSDRMIAYIHHYAGAAPANRDKRAMLDRIPWKVTA